MGNRGKYLPKSHLTDLEDGKIPLGHTGLISLCLPAAANPMDPHSTVPIAGSSISSWSGRSQAIELARFSHQLSAKRQEQSASAYFQPTVQRKLISLICHGVVFVLMRLPQLKGMHIVKRSGSERQWHPKPLSTHHCLTLARDSILGQMGTLGLGDLSAPNSSSA